MERKEEEKPPILGRWVNLYVLVIGTLAVVMLLFYLFTKHFE